MATSSTRLLPPFPTEDAILIVSMAALRLDLLRGDEKAADVIEQAQEPKLESAVLTLRAMPGAQNKRHGELNLRASKRTRRSAPTSESRIPACCLLTTRYPRPAAARRSAPRYRTRIRSRDRDPCLPPSAGAAVAARPPGSFDGKVPRAHFVLFVTSATLSPSPRRTVTRPCHRDLFRTSPCRICLARATRCNVPEMVCHPRCGRCSTTSMNFRSSLPCPTR